MTVVPPPLVRMAARRVKKNKYGKFSRVDDNGAGAAADPLEVLMEESARRNRQLAREMAVAGSNNNRRSQPKIAPPPKPQFPDTGTIDVSVLSRWLE